MSARPEPVLAAEELAESLLFPQASTVDATGELPREHLDALAAASLYGVSAPPGLGGVSATELGLIVEALAGGCLSTAFVWIQHLGAVRAAAAASAELRRAWLRPLCTGDRRAAVAQAGVRPGPAMLRATPIDGGYQIDGDAPWVTGWGLVDVVHTAARLSDDMVVWALIDAEPGATLTAEPVDLVAVNASRTVHLRFRRHVVPESRVTSTVPLAEWPARDAAGLGPNGSLSLGAAGRAIRLLEPLAAAVSDPLGAELEARREQLRTAGAAAMPGARAAASELALRCAGALVAASGSTGIVEGQHAQRLLREAAFLLVFGSRPAIREDLLRRVARPAPG